jgi:hypothetical protein
MLRSGLPASRCTIRSERRGGLHDSSILRTSTTAITRSVCYSANATTAGPQPASRPRPCCKDRVCRGCAYGCSHTKRTVRWILDYGCHRSHTRPRRVRAPEWYRPAGLEASQQDGGEQRPTHCNPPACLGGLNLAKEPGPNNPDVFRQSPVVPSTRTDCVAGKRKPGTRCEREPGSRKENTTTGQR